MNPAATDPYRRWRRSLFWLSMPLGAAAVVLVLLVVVGTFVAIGAASRSGGGSSSVRGGSSAGRSEHAAADLTDLTAQVSVAASSTAPDAFDAAHTSVSYQARNLIDGRPETAWRTAGDVPNVVITLMLPVATRLETVGLLPGYDKIDPVDGSNRFLENNRVALARWIFDDGSHVDQRFRDAAQLQIRQVNAVTRTVRLRILQIYAGSLFSNGSGGFTAISDVRLAGPA